MMMMMMTNGTRVILSRPTDAFTIADVQKNRLLERIMLTLLLVMQ